MFDQHRSNRQVCPPAPTSRLTDCPGDLDAEIALVREAIRLLGERLSAAPGQPRLPLYELLRVADGLSQTSHCLAGLLQAQRALDGAQDVNSALNRALDEVIRDLTQDR